MSIVKRFAAVAILVLTFFPAMTGAQSSPGNREQVLLLSANRDRQAQGLPALKWNSALATAARQHALSMARQNTLSHQLPGEPDLAARASRAGVRFSTVAENVAVGPSAEEIHKGWMNSPPHRANLLDPQVTAVGIAVAAANGTLFAVEDFSDTVAELSLQDQEKLVATQLQSRGIALLSYTSEARKTCALDNGYAGTHEPSFVLHYATSDLKALPELLKQRIRTGKYHNGAVGACLAEQKKGFSGYRIAVMLYE
jgi:Cysteine-rich secretory protein family